jgi:hypothetical protein
MKVDLINNLGHVSIQLPLELDTFYSWTNQSDYRDGNLIQYRFANNKCTLLKESGTFYLIDFDTVQLYQLTFSHLQYLDSNTKITYKIDKVFVDDYASRVLQENKNTNWIYKNTARINNRDYAVFIQNNFRKDNQITSIFAVTALDKCLLNINFEYYGHQQDKFIATMTKSLST